MLYTYHPTTPITHNAPVFYTFFFILTFDVSTHNYQIILILTIEVLLLYALFNNTFLLSLISHNAHNVLYTFHFTFLNTMVYAINTHLLIKKVSYISIQIIASSTTLTPHPYYS